MILPANQWYPVLESREVGRRPFGVERLGARLVFWRTADGFPHAHPDRCPHLGAALSGGRIEADRLVCPFHGFEFDGQGRCVHIPANGRRRKIPEGMALPSLVLREAHGFIWLWRGEIRDLYPELPYFAPLETGWRHGTVAVDWPVHYTRAIENQLDVAHLAFVHRSTIGGGGRAFVEGPYVEADQQDIKVWVTNARDEGQATRGVAELKAAAAGREPSLHFKFPGVWLLNLSPRLKNFIAFTPINERKTRYYLRVYHRYLNPLAAKPFEALMGLSNRFILNQDKRVVVTQTPRESPPPGEDRLIEADRAIARFRTLHASLLEEAGSAGPADGGE
ncbi:aromatic ring-hydroxylating dioxygenase subunit alpha [uncultured Rhodoblastus sp.]|uniref:aromatic ring-hydroxylating oxygenase subunit alpha n=1 Tax=uncultured Rhodoblastus sp. TaxID=543037 RepID=UPI0025EC064E|nr:aromatic ring-hydroxylating dioxygenase subunit alpha [uncultured Rhodoblastus sp.]